MIIDMHVHLLRQQGYEHHLARSAREAGIDKMVLLGGPEQYDSAPNRAVLDAAERYPDLFVPFAYFRLGRDYPGLVDLLRSQGFAGVHFALPQRAYDDKEFYLVYARAGQLGMPALFELGLVPSSGHDHVYDVCCGRMRPVMLDTVARAFPELSVIGTRLGSPWCEEACEVARCNTNVYLDLSGTLLKRKGPEFFREMLWWDETSAAYDGGPQPTAPWKKIVFGSGAHYSHLGSIRRDYEHLFDALGLDDAVRADVMCHNAIRALGLDY